MPHTAYAPAQDSELQARYARYKEILKGLTIMSDVFMRNVLKDPACTEYILQVIMEQQGLRVVEQVIQQDYKNLQGRSAILDCVVRDAQGRRFNVEIQQDNEGASPKRARYHSGLMDMNTLAAGQDFDQLPESHVIFITRGDPLGFGLPIYHIARSIQELGRPFADEAYIIYVNSHNKQNTPLGRLMHDFHCTDAADFNSEVLAQRVRELKQTDEGVDTMCKEMDRIYREGEARGEARGFARGEIQGEARGFARGEIQGEARGKASGRQEAKHEMALSLASLGMPAEQIALVAKVSVELVREWLAGESAPQPAN